MSFDENNSTVTVIYNDHSIYSWNVRDLKKVKKTGASLYHAGCVWGVDTHQAGIFVTCSSDDTVRVWNFTQKVGNGGGPVSVLGKILYFDPQFSALKERTTLCGVRCVSISPDGAHLASGDRAGNIRVHDLHTMQELCRIEAHDAEILSLQFSTQSYLASTSRDRLIHVFDSAKNYEFLNTLDDHSSSITAVKFSSGQDPQMVSCGADKTIIFRKMKKDSEGLTLHRANQIVAKTTLYDMELDVAGEHILTACQDRNIRVYSVADAKLIRTLKGCASDDGAVIRSIHPLRSKKDDPKTRLNQHQSFSGQILPHFDINNLCSSKTQKIRNRHISP